MLRLILFSLVTALTAIATFRALSFFKDVVKPEEITVNDFAGDDGEPETLEQFSKPPIDRSHFKESNDAE